MPSRVPFLFESEYLECAPKILYICQAYATLKISHAVAKTKTYRQWRIQPDNLVPLCKFQSIIVINFFRN